MYLRTLTIIEKWGGNMGQGVHARMSTWKEFENVQNYFLTKFLQVEKQTSCALLLEMGSFPIEIMVMQRVVGYIFKVQKN